MAKKCKLIKVTPPLEPRPKKTVDNDEIKKEIAKKIWWKNECFKEILWFLLLAAGLLGLSAMGWYCIGEMVSFRAWYSTVISVVSCAAVVMATYAFVLKVLVDIPEAIRDFIDAKRDLENSLDT
ncbi:MAG: hypothetical protein IKU25_03475 [Clostridia bacterium]|nr:hypothetical protein [Clostridia bacterium]